MRFFFSSRRRHTRYWRDWSSDVCSSDLEDAVRVLGLHLVALHLRWKRDGPLKPPDEAFRTVRFGAFNFFLALALARNAENAVVEGNINIPLLQTGNFGFHDDVVLVLVQID